MSSAYRLADDPTKALSKQNYIDFTRARKHDQVSSQPLLQPKLGTVRQLGCMATEFTAYSLPQTLQIGVHVCYQLEVTRNKSPSLVMCQFNISQPSYLNLPNSSLS